MSNLFSKPKGPIQPPPPPEVEDVQEQVRKRARESAARRRTRGGRGRQGTILSGEPTQLLGE